MQVQILYYRPIRQSAAECASVAVHVTVQALKNIHSQVHLDARQQQYRQETLMLLLAVAA